MEVSKEERSHMAKEGLSYQPHMPYVLLTFIGLAVAAFAFVIWRSLNG